MEKINVYGSGYHIFVNFNDERINLHQLNKDLALALEHTIRQIGAVEGKG